jgi:hypothetical protein
MDITLCLYKGTVYIPTAYLLKKGPLYFFRSPIAAVPIMRSEDLREAILAAIKQGNPEISAEEYQARSRAKTGSLLEVTGSKSDYKFDREVSGWWSVSDRGGLYAIGVDIPYPKYGWHEDKEKRVQFPADTSIDDVVSRVVAMMQQREREHQGGTPAPTPSAPRPDP